jgi:two-component system sensor kinase FixL
MRVNSGRDGMCTLTSEGEHIRTLLVGEKAELRKAIQEALEKRNHDLILCERLQDAFVTFERLRPCLVVLACTTADSIAFCRYVKQKVGLQVVTILTVVADDEQSYIPALIEAGADDYVLSPLDPFRVNARIMFAESKAREKLRQRQVAAELESRVRQQAVVSELGQRALAGEPIQSIVDYAVHAMAEATDVPFCRILERLPDGSGLLLNAAVGWDQNLIGKAVIPIRPGTQAGYTLLSSEPVVIEDLSTETRFREPEMLRDYGIVSGMSVAIAGEREVYGVLSVHATHHRVFSENDLHFLQSVANVLAAAIEQKNAEKALRESEAKSRAILETTVDGVITIDANGIIESFNPAAERIFGYSEEEVIGRNVSILMPEPYSTDHDGYMRSYHETGKRKIIGIGREVVGRRKNGETFPLDLAVSEVDLGGRHIFTGIVRDITERRLLEQEILDTSELERRRIGQDLHDGLGQMLTGIGLISRNLARKLADTNPEVSAEISEITDLIKEADQHARGLARSLVPVELDASGLNAALQRLAANAERLFGLRCTFEAFGSTPIEDNTAATNLYRIAQESVSNAVKHGRATHVTISLASGEDQIRLRVQDNGVGFPEVPVDHTGMGVRIMHHRARIIGATLEIRNAPEGGTVVTCTLLRSGHRPSKVKSGLYA